MRWHRQAMFEFKGDKLSSSAEYKIRCWEVWDTNSPVVSLNAHSQTDWAIEDQAKNLNLVARPLL